MPVAIGIFTKRPFQERNMISCFLLEWFGYADTILQSGIIEPVHPARCSSIFLKGSDRFGSIRSTCINANALNPPLAVVCWSTASDVTKIVPLDITHQRVKDKDFR